MDLETAIQVAHNLFHKHNTKVIIFQHEGHYDFCCEEMYGGAIEHHNVKYICTVDRK